MWGNRQGTEGRRFPVWTALVAVLGTVFLFSGCFRETGPAEPSGDELRVRLKTVVPRVNALSKGQTITLAKLVNVFTSNVNDTVRDTLTTSTTPALSAVSTDSQTVVKSYSLKGLRVWKVVATVIDTRGFVIHRDSATLGSFLKIADTVSVSLGLVARYSMYEAKFLSLPDSISSATGPSKQELRINRLVLKVDGVTVRDSIVLPWFAPLTVHSLPYDYVSVGNGTWKALASGTSRKLYAVQFPGGSDTGYAVGDTVVMRTLNGGATWTATAAVPRSMRYLSFVNGLNGVIGGDSATVGRTTDGGASWTFQKLSNFTSAAAPVFMVNDTGFSLTNSPAPTGATTYRYTTNGGVGVWGTYSGFANNIFALSCVGTAKCWAAGHLGTIRKNATFNDAFGTTLASGTSQTLRGLSFADANTGWAVGDAGTILKTTNGGTSWAAQASGTTQDLRAVTFLDATLGFAAGSAGTLLATTNGGNTWIPQTSGTTQNLNGLSFSGPKGYAVGDGGALLTLTDVHLVQMLAYGTMTGWNAANPFFSGSRFVNAIAGNDITLALDLNWVGPQTGTGKLSATIGKVGTTRLTGSTNGTGVFPKKNR